MTAPAWPGEPVWLISGYDFRRHAFRDAEGTADFLRALCTHSVPRVRLVDPTDTALKAPDCVSCKLILGGELADRAGDGTDWSL